MSGKIRVEERRAGVELCGDVEMTHHRARNTGVEDEAALEWGGVGQAFQRLRRRTRRREQGGV